MEEAEVQSERNHAGLSKMAWRNIIRHKDLLRALDAYT